MGIPAHPLIVSRVSHDNLIKIFEGFKWFGRRTSTASMWGNDGHPSLALPNDAMNSVSRITFTRACGLTIFKDFSLFLVDTYNK